MKNMRHVNFARGISSFKSCEDRIFRDVRGLAATGVALACTVLVLSVLVSWLMGAGQSDCNGPSHFDGRKLMVMVAIGPFLESIILALAVMPFVKAKPLVLSVAIGILAGALHVMATGWVAFVTCIPFAFYARTFQIGFIDNGVWTGIWRSWVIHAAYNLLLYSVIQYCGG